MVLAGALLLAAGAGYAYATSSSSAPPVRTVTVTLRNGATGATGARGPTGPAGATSCPDGFAAGVLVVNHPGGQVRLFTCLDGG